MTAAANATIRENDARWSCPNNDAGTNFVYDSSGVGVPVGEIVVDTRFLDTQRLTAEAFAVSDLLNELRQQLVDAIERKEALFENKYRYGEIHPDLGTVRALSTKLRRAKEGLRMWNNSAQDAVADLLDELNYYESLRDSIRMFGNRSFTKIGGLMDDPASVAKQKLSTEKSLKVYHKRLRASNTEINRALADLKSRLNNFANGNIRYGEENRRSVNLEELFSELDALYGDGSPLNRVRNELVDRVNRSSLRFSMDAEQTVDLDTNPGLSRRVTRSTLIPDRTLDDRLRKLEELAETVIYTDSTRPKLERIIETSYQLFDDQPPNSFLRARLDAAAKRIRESAPTEVRRQIVERLEDIDPPLEYLSWRLNTIVSRLSPDSEEAVWRDSFEETRRRVDEALRQQVNLDMQRNQPPGRTAPSSASAPGDSGGGVGDDDYDDDDDLMSFESEVVRPPTNGAKRRRLYSSSSSADVGDDDAGPSGTSVGRLVTVVEADEEMPVVSGTDGQQQQ